MKNGRPWPWMHPCSKTRFSRRWHGGFQAAWFPTAGDNRASEGKTEGVRQRGIPVPRGVAQDRAKSRKEMGKMQRELPHRMHLPMLATNDSMSPRAES